MEEFEKALQRLREQESVPQNHVDLYRDIFKAQSRVKKRISSRLSPELRRGLDKRLEEGLPFLSADGVEIPSEGLEDLFDEICSAMKKHSRQSIEDIQVLEEARKTGKLSFVDLVRSVAFDKGEYCRAIAGQFVLRQELLIFMGMALARPIFELWAERLRGRVKDEGWLRPYCPICGSEPYMAKLQREDGRRILGCPVCGTEWTFMRIECPFCLNKDQKTLRYFFVDEDSPHRVDVCEKCRRYIKTIDERKAEEGETFLLIEDIATTYLDVLAEREGYMKGEQRLPA